MISRPRRFVLAGITLVLCAILFRGSVASALVTRGDGFFVAGDVARARIYYGRAIAIAPNLEIAAERFAFSALEAPSPTAIPGAIAVASRFLLREPGDDAVRLDRALLERHEEHDSAAAADFVTLAQHGRDARYVDLAAALAQRRGERLRARRLWQMALRFDRRDAVASRALAARPSAR